MNQNSDFNNFVNMLEKKKMNPDGWSNTNYTIEEKNSNEIRVFVDDTGWCFDKAGNFVGMFNFKE